MKPNKEISSSEYEYTVLPVSIIENGTRMNVLKNICPRRFWKMIINILMRRGEYIDVRT